MFGWLSGRTPLTTRQLLENTEPKRIKRALTQIQLVSYKQEFIIRKLPLFKRIKAFFTNSNVNVVFVKFTVETRNKVNGNQHFVILEIPYLKELSSKTLSDIPIKVYSDTMDLKYRFVYELNKTNNLYYDSSLKNVLGIALTEKPTKVTPKGVAMFDKHIYAVISNINKLKIKY
ncbi:structural protein [Yersinia phage YerA41]|uniref:Structural protein n=1 Tax=Yersinia phage vB_Yru_GN1 TaxID=3074381 RepID=A0AA86MDC4_9CAUD|nr:structural protein [Yersinia phage YerA41]BES79928.1 structural protein [Yersinia phage vB_Yru_GN1]